MSCFKSSSKSDAEPLFFGFILTGSCLTSPLFAEAEAANSAIEGALTTEAEKTADKKSKADDPAPLIWWNREITTFRTSAEKLTPTQRADAAKKQLQSLTRETLNTSFTSQNASFEGKPSVRFLIGETYLFSFLEDDLDRLSGEKLDQSARHTLAALEEVRTARLNQASARYLAKSTGRAAIATLIFVVAIIILRRITQKLSKLIVGRVKAWKRLRINRRADLRPQIAAVCEQFVKIPSFALGLYAFCVWIAYVFNQFPRTEPFGNTFTGHLIKLGKSILTEIAGALPGLATAAIILLIARWVARLANGTIDSLGDDSNKGVMASDTAKATRRIAVAFIWLFAVVLAYPYLPGSGSEAFKGLSVLIGLMVSLGSSGLINQIMSGFVLLYSGSVRTGEYVKVGEIEGTITEMGLLAVKVLNPASEFLVIPNAVMLSNPMTNFSRLRDETGVPIKSVVTIGYDAPWRQVHELLETSAAATSLVLKDPAPKVIQQALSDWYPEYTLICYVSDPATRNAAISELNGHIQDAFNEAEIQIMSPHYREDPPEPLVIPKDRWFPKASPAAKPEV